MQSCQFKFYGNLIYLACIAFHWRLRIKDLYCVHIICNRSLWQPFFQTSSHSPSPSPRPQWWAMTAARTLWARSTGGRIPPGLYRASAVVWLRCWSSSCGQACGVDRTRSKDWHESLWGKWSSHPNLPRRSRSSKSGSRSGNRSRSICSSNTSSSNLAV